MGVFKLPTVQAVWIGSLVFNVCFTDATSSCSWYPQGHLKFRCIPEAHSSDPFVFSHAVNCDTSAERC